MMDKLTLQGWVSAMMMSCLLYVLFFFSSRRRHTRFDCDWSSDVCSSDLKPILPADFAARISRGVQIDVGASGFDRGNNVGDGIWPDRHKHPKICPVCLRQIGRASCRERV